MILGVGTDLLKIQRILDFKNRKGDPFFVKVFTRLEHAQAALRPDPTLYYATRFAGKEAVFKCFGIASNYAQLHEIEILSMESGMPYVTIHGKLKEIAQKKGIHTIQLSLSYDSDYATAFAVASGA